MVSGDWGLVLGEWWVGEFLLTQRSDWSGSVDWGLKTKKAKKVIKNYRSAAYGIEGLKTIFALCLLIYSKMMMIETYVCVE